MTDTVTSKKPSPRHLARSYAVQGIYEWLVKGGSNAVPLGEIDAHIQGLDGFDAANFTLFKSIFYGVCRDSEQLRPAFLPYLDRPLAELSLVEHAILLMGTFEFIHHPDVPYKVVINEYVELTKDFGSNDGFKYVNGILDRLALDLRQAEVNATRR